MKALGLISRPPVGGTHSNFTWVKAHRPKPKKDQISLQVKATALNVDDAHIAEGTAFGGIPMGLPKPSSKKPLILGMDVSGIVDAIGEGVTDFRVGDRVFGVIYPWSRLGGMAPYCCAKVNQFHPLPKDWSFEDGAAMGVAGATACATLKILGDLTNKRCVVVGASGSIGSILVQALSKSNTSEVIGICSAANVSHVISIGANRVIDYNSGPWGDLVAQGGDKTVDLIIDCIGGKDTEIEALKLLNKDGHFVTLCGPVRFFGDEQTSLASLMKIYTHLITRMLFSRFKGPKYTLTYGTLPDWKMIQETLIDNGIKSTIDNIYAYSEEGVEGAFKRLQSHRNRGKIVISSNEAQ